MNQEEIASFYDTQAGRKVQDFVNLNNRVELGWQTIVEWGGRPGRILEVGCGVGSICWRMARHYRDAEVVGVDFSQGNLAIAQRAFAVRNVKFELLSVADDFDFGVFDLVVLMDVYEHVAVAERAALHANLKKSLTTNGRLLLSFPTPRHLAWLREHNPTEIQPVDEDIDVDTVSALARDLDRDVLMYREVNVWRGGDYAHAALGVSAFPEPVRRAGGWLARLRVKCERLRRRALIHRAGRL